MEIQKHLVATCSQKNKFSETTLHDSIWNHQLLCKHTMNNTKSLSQRYNELIEEALEDNVDCLILVHDDVILEEDPIPKLEKLFDDYDLVGVAGTSKIELQSPALWHIMGGGFDGDNLHGCVQHLIEKHPGKNIKEYYDKPAATKFGPYPHRAVMIDGVFMALNRKAMETVRFDEDNPCKFHFYDLCYSLDCHLAGLKVGVGDILITHESPGLREFTEDWRAGEQYFLSKYAY